MAAGRCVFCPGRYVKYKVRRRLQNQDVRSEILRQSVKGTRASAGAIMSTKRKYQEENPQEAIHESRQFQVYGNAPKPSKKPRRLEPRVQRKQAHASSVNAIKKRIRDVTRKLERKEDLPANVRAEDERALAAYQQELGSAQAEKTRQKMIKKYHMVRFFGR